MEAVYDGCKRSSKKRGFAAGSRAGRIEGDSLRFPRSRRCRGRIATWIFWLLSRESQTIVREMVRLHQVLQPCACPGRCVGDLQSEFSRSGTTRPGLFSTKPPRKGGSSMQSAKLVKSPVSDSGHVAPSSLLLGQEEFPSRSSTGMDCSKHRHTFNCPYGTSSRGRRSKAQR